MLKWLFGPQLNKIGIIRVKNIIQAGDELGQAQLKL